MCGISGFFDRYRNSTKEDLIRMSDALQHRGPDDSGNELFELSEGLLGFGFRRLAILDLSVTGHQPMTDPASGNWIIFNGEIYNFREIKSILEKAGHKFISQSDTEVILNAYLEWGIDCVSRFIGMFAIALFDHRAKKLFLVRDRAGVKPLFYYSANGIFLFASELKSFHKHPGFKKEIDASALGLFFQQGYIPAPYSIFKNTYKVKPGHFITLDLASGEENESCYWNAVDAYNQPPRKIEWNDAIEETEKLLVSAFQYRMVSDVPVGVFLSGGYDSSCVTALLQKNSSRKIKTFTIGFEDQKYNEAAYAREVAEYLGTDHHEYFCTYNEAMDLVPKLADIYDEPFGDQSAIPTTLVSKIARKEVTVALSADAGDELFAGYPRHRRSFRHINNFRKIPKPAGKLFSYFLKPSADRDLAVQQRKEKFYLALQTQDPVELFKIINQAFTFSETNELLHPSIENRNTRFDDDHLFKNHVSSLNRILATEYTTYLVDDILQKVDRASMSVSLEGQEPFLDHRLLEWIATLPDSFKMNENKQKILLKAIVEKNIPRELIDRPKMGFGVPLVDWMKTDLRNLFDEHLNDQALAKSGLIHVQKAASIRDAYLNGKLENFERLWFIFIFQQWYMRWMEPNS